MVTVKFVNSVKYGGVLIQAHTPFLAKEEDLESLRQSGAIVLDEQPTVEPVDPLGVVTEDVPEEVEVEPEAPQEPEEEPEEEPEAMPAVKHELAKMTTNELKQYAAAAGIEVPANGSKADIFNTIVKSLG